MSLVVQNLTLKIGKVQILNDISFEVNRGECLALLGPSGCGKSSTLRLIAGLDAPTNGKIIINRREITRVESVDRGVGMVFQSYALFPHLNVIENLALGLRIRNYRNEEIQTKVSTILSMMKLEECALRKPGGLSGGQRQRVALARVLLRDPDVYLLDEPMSNLDAQLREDLRMELRSLILNKRQSVVYVTHDQQEAMAMANKIAILKDGKIEQIGTPNDLYNNPCSIFVASFIGRPQINLFKESHGIIVGVRPEDIYLDSNGLESKVSYSEWQGKNRLLTVENKWGKLRMNIDSHIEIRENIKISWNKSSEYYFNSNTGIRLVK